MRLSPRETYDGPYLLPRSNRPWRKNEQTTTLPIDLSTILAAQQLNGRLSFHRSGGSNYSSQGSLSSQMRSRQRASPARNARCQGTELSRRVSPSEKLPRPQAQRKDRSCPKLQAKAASICGNIP